MKDRRVRDYDAQLVDGLTHHERLAKLDATVYGDRYHDGLLERVQELESIARRRAMPFWLRWLVTTGLKRETK